MHGGGMHGAARMPGSSSGTPAPVSTPSAAGTIPAAGPHARGRCRHRAVTGSASPASRKPQADDAVTQPRPRAQRRPGLVACAARCLLPVRSGACRHCPPAAGLHLARFEDLVALAEEKRDIVIKAGAGARCAAGAFRGRADRIRPSPRGARRDLAPELMRKLADWTGRRWVVALSSQPGAPSLREQAEAAERERKRGAADHPLVRSVLDNFPGARIRRCARPSRRRCRP